jgi:anti-anti-sigma regulatory factor
MMVELPAEMVLARAREVRAQLLSALAAGEPLELDTGKVEQVDVTGLQLLCALHKSAAAHGQTLVFSETREGDVMSAAALRAGFRRHQGCLPGCLWAGTRP